MSAVQFSPRKGSTSSSFAWQAVGSRRGASIHATSLPKNTIGLFVCIQWIYIFVWERDKSLLPVCPSHLGYISSAETAAISGQWSVVRLGGVPGFFWLSTLTSFLVLVFFLCRFIGHNHLEFIQIAWIRRKSSSWMRPKDIHTHIHSPVYDRFYEYFFVNFLVFVLLLRRCPNFGRVEP